MRNGNDSLVTKEKYRDVSSRWGLWEMKAELPHARNQRDVKWSSTVLPWKQPSMPVLSKTASQVPLAITCQNEALLEIIQCFRLQNNEVTLGQGHCRVQSPMLTHSHNNVGCCLMTGADGDGEKEKATVRSHKPWEVWKFLAYIWKDSENLH